MYKSRRQTSPQMNKILLIHADWLENDGQHAKAKECRKQAINFWQNKDLRQTEGYSERRRYERSDV
jgi:hypothetical protein